jgi:hypothetical protein
MPIAGKPEAVVNKFARGYRAGRYAEIYDLYSEKSEIRSKYSRTAYSSRMRITAKRTKMEIQEAHVAGSEVQDDRARVTLISTTKSIVGEWHVEEQFTLIREDGDWKILDVKKVRQWPSKEGGTSTRGRL